MSFALVLKHLMSYSIILLKRRLTTHVGAAHFLYFYVIDFLVSYDRKQIRSNWQAFRRNNHLTSHISDKNSC